MDLARLAGPLWAAAVPLAACAAVFALLALAVKGRRAVADARAAADETRVNLILLVVDRLAVGPVVGLFVAGVTGLLRGALDLEPAGVFAWLGVPATLFLAVFVGDFVGYWRHRAQHCAWLWPAHAVHHSDPRLTWLSLERMHPVDRLGTAFDAIILGVLGFPAWALAINALVRHYYGYFIHADLPWTFGKASLVLNSPAMHRWHHARDVEGSGANFATVFSVFDRAFGTYHQPGPCDVPLGVREDLGVGVLGQYLHPVRAWSRALRARRAGLQPS